jgi:hypothetical protein
MNTFKKLLVSKLLFLVITSLALLKCQNIKEETLLWDTNYKLSFEDFKAPLPDTKNVIKVYRIQEGLYGNLKKYDDETKFFIATILSRSKSYILPLKSWYHPEKKELEFEWGNIYMNLLEIETRKLRRLLIEEYIVIENKTQLLEHIHRSLDVHQQNWKSLISIYEDSYYEKDVINDLKDSLKIELNKLNKYAFKANTYIDKEFMKRINTVPN